MYAVDWRERLSRMRKDGTIKTRSMQKKEGRNEKDEEKPVIKDRL